MTRTYAKGRYNKSLWKYRKGYAKRGCPHGHCFICGYDPRTKGQLKTQQRNFFKFHIFPFIEDYLDNENLNSL